MRGRQTIGRCAWGLAFALVVGSLTGCGGEEQPQGTSLPLKAAAVTIADGKVVSLGFTVKLEDGTIVGTSDGGDPLVYQHGAGGLLPALEAKLIGLGPGEKLQVTLTSDEAYGPANPDAVREVPLDQIPEASRQVGAVIEGRSPEGQVGRARIAEVREDVAVVDFNHPLAGRTLIWDIEVREIGDPPPPQAAGAAPPDGAEPPATP